MNSIAEPNLYENKNTKLSVDFFKSNSCREEAVLYFDQPDTDLNNKEFSQCVEVFLDDLKEIVKRLRAEGVEI